MIANGGLGDHAHSALPQLAKLMRGVLDKSIKKVAERDAAIRDISTIISNCLPFYTNGGDSDVYPLSLLVEDLCSLSLLEVKENGDKMSKSRSTCKTVCFEMTIAVLNKMCEKHLLCDDYGHVFQFVSRILDQPYLDANIWMEDDLSNFLAKFIVSNFSIIAQDQLAKIWSITWRRFTVAVERGGKSAGNYLRISVTILKQLNKTSLLSGDSGSTFISELTETFFGAMRKRDIKRWNGQITHAFELISVLVDDWGIECRDVLLSHCLPFASAFVDKLDFSSPLDNEMDAVWTFFDGLFHLAVPDCKPSCLVPQNAYTLAQSACEVLRKALISTSLSRADYVLPPKNVPLFARVLVIADRPSSCELDVSVAVYTQRVKRRRNAELLDWCDADVTDCNDRPLFIVSCLSIGIEVFSRWASRIDSDKLAAMADKLWSASDRIKLSSQKSRYCRILDVLVCCGAFDSVCDKNLETIGNLWKYATNAVHTPGVFESASALLITLLKKYNSVLSKNDDVVYVICEALSRSCESHEDAVYNLVTFVLTEFEFDELDNFSGIADKKRGLEEWRFRCQIAEWLVDHLEPKCNIGHLLYLLCSLHPSAATAIGTSLSTEKSAIEKDLELFRLVETSTGSKNADPAPLVIVDEMVDYITQLISQFWSNCDVPVEKRISLWCSYAAFVSKLEPGLYCETMDVLEDMNKGICQIVSMAEPELLSHFRPVYVLPSVISSKLYQLLVTRLPECPSLAPYLVIFPRQLEVAANNIRNVMREIGNHVMQWNDETLRQAAGRLLESFTDCVDTVPDLLILFDECGGIIDSKTRERLYRRISLIINEDIGGGEYSEQEGEIYRRLLCMYALRTWEPGQSVPVDLSTVSASWVIRYFHAIPESVLDWNFVSSLLERTSSNVILTLKLARSILGDPAKFQLHKPLLHAIMKSGIQACEELIPDFASILDCYYNSIILSSPAASEIAQLPVLSPTQQFRKDNLVEAFRTRNPNLVAMDAFPALFFVDVGCSERNFMCDVFWRVFKKDPHAVLLSMWEAATASIARNSSLLLIRNIMAIAESSSRIALNEKMKRGVDIAIFSTVCSVSHLCAEKGCSVKKMILYELTKANYFSADDISLIRGCCEQPSALENVMDYSPFKTQIQEFLRTGDLQNIRLFHIPLFWRCLRLSLEGEPGVLSSMTPTIKKSIISYLLVAWEVVPRIRRFIVPVLSLMKYNSSLIPIRALNYDNVIRLIRDYCLLKITDPRFDSVDVVDSCIRILSCEVFQEQSILRPAAARHDLQHSSDSGGWMPCLFRDVLKATVLESSGSRVFRVIEECAGFVPELCHLVVPYVFALDTSDSESAVDVLLQYASLIDQSDVEESMRPGLRRMASCLAECVDGVGLFRLSRFSLSSQQYLEQMCSLIRCCLIAELPNHAFSVANVLHDMLMAEEGTRHSAAFDGTKVTNRRFNDVLKDIYLALGSTAALGTLPTELQNDNRVRLLFSKARFNWLDVMSSPEASCSDLVDAYWFCGVDYAGQSKQLKYALAIRTNKWKAVSYPKRLLSHEERMFAALHVARRSSGLLERLLDHIANIECENSVNRALPPSEVFGHLRSLEVLRPGNTYTFQDFREMPIDSLVLRTTLMLRSDEDCSLSRSGDGCESAISVLLRKLCEQKAFSPCLKILERFSDSQAVIERCRVLVAKGEINTAEHLLRVFVDPASGNNTEYVVEARCLLAELLADRKNMLDESITLLRENLNLIDKYDISHEGQLRMFTLLHRLAARQLSAIEEHMESRAFRMREDAIREWTRQRNVASQRAPSHAARRIECELRCEKGAVESAKKKLLASAVETLSASLEALKLLSLPYVKEPCQSSERNGVILRLIFPLIDVLFRFDTEADVVNTFKTYIGKSMVPTVWVNVVGHLMSHCFTKSLLAPVIRTMIVKLIIAYPYHVLHTVLMYKFNENHAYIVNSMLGEAERRVSDKNDRCRLHEIIEDMTAAHVAYMQFVAAKISDLRFFNKRQIAGSAAQYEMLDGLSIVSLVETLKRVPLPVIEQKLGLAGDYSGSNIVMWGAMERNEDVRQDCLVEQLFSVVNGILNQNESQAFLRTYKVVPLDAKSGIIEFCQGTTSLKELLCGMNLISGLHVKMEPKNKTPLQMRTMLKDVAKSQVAQASKLFREACTHFQPVFRHYFYERHRDVKSWTRMINNYRRSLAQWSTVTYVVGLGDRHLSNVLFEVDTCKLVHIDLGMILEYSKRSLPIPERVPFRLTRDLLDPILIEGTEGRLAVEAVRAMRLLRDSKQVILGLASVLLRETISNFEEVESNMGERPSFVSETAIARLRDKLNGTDDTFGVQNVEHQVRRLFAEATNVDNLSRMFVGWMPFV
ncbi:hypothetical protein Q1695_009798 [Nippostrongylus brasiliensis]|nr:hypothetical protein Q1695_009798 [Nippostrongylus brasiliensis]